MSSVIQMNLLMACSLQSTELIQFNDIVQDRVLLGVTFINNIAL